MKKTILPLILSLVCLCAAAQEHLAERTYVSTDKSSYLAGETVWCSAFCTDASAGTLSGFSAVAYLELHSSAGMVATAKVALRDGRGAGRLEIPVNAPTGNYVLLAYTAQSVNEDSFDYLANARTISVYNTFTSERVPGGVEIVDDIPSDENVSASDGVEIKPLKDGTFSVRNLSGESATISVSVYCDDSLVSSDKGDIRSFSSRADVGALTFSDRRIPEYDGEIVYGRVAGADPSRLEGLEGKFAFISVPGDRSDTYSCQIDAGGNATFFTNNLYGDKDLVCQIEDPDAGEGCHLEIDSPFVNVPVGNVPTLKLSPAMAEDLSRRSAGVQIERLFASDTLYERLPVRDNLLFGDEGVTYVLDDYTRLPLMEECIVEFIQELRARKDADGRRDLQVRMEDIYRSTYYAKGASLMMVDGVPVFDHEIIYRYDPLLVETVNIYPHTYFIGARGYSGVVNFVTYKRNLPGVTFPDNVRILDFKGVSYPQAYTCAGVSDDYPDYRNTLYWDPLVDLPSDGSLSFDVHMPAYEGRWRIVVEGLTASGRPLFAEL